ncbi:MULTISPECIES: ABC transporter permease [unclassified Streptomyces]|uniref:ABC transporter permease n=1 Tax=unclassified Streptomyces TaxID=2593676 RepID=UPI002DD9D098|nr:MULTISPECIES: ABC transporter permease [unclassified Streptomyces]WSF88442.1 ABC transporter permease [Streptomyces sp. NBC_01744]WSC35357.1 ABC transporter permease [Streptomyces sp. NBC_01763]WSC43712.1 ABC transporter permease [Streptomyces sp. NBC_01762]WSC57340.1 ABC transporter permease [Streptomyces sp. NBC_01761]WSD23248.1 ABC transporter permease [Streptomyces sp. NBC_01751]
MTLGHALAPPDISEEIDTPDPHTAVELEPVVPESARGSRLRSVPRPLRRAIGPVLLLALWQVLSATGVLHPDVLASPGTIARAGSDLIADGTLPSAMGISLRRVAVGLVLGGVVGTALALVSGLSRLGEDVVDATVQMLRTVPWVGLIPLFIIWLGIGEAPKVALIALGVAFHLYLNVYAGIRGVDEQLIEAGQSLGLGRWGLIRHVVLPGALPGAMTGLRYSLATAWLALVFSESVNADAGIGFLMNQAREFFRTDVIVVCLVVYAFLGLTADVIVRILERLLLQWRPTFTGQ